MGSLNGKSVHEFMDKSHFSPEVDAKKFHPTYTAEIGSCSEGVQTSRNIMFTLRNVVCENIKKVVFSSKLNLLMPFGPLAILVEKLTGHRVSGSSPCLESFVLLFKYVFVHFSLVNYRVGSSF
jgi:Ca2+:H+ antiporter